MMLESNTPLRLLGLVDAAGVTAVGGASVWGLMSGAPAPYCVVSLAFAVLWAYKAWVMSDLLGAWFPARFGMNGGRMYEAHMPWCVATMLGIAALLVAAGADAVGGNALAAAWGLLAAGAVGRAAVPHLVMGWLEARRMTSMPPGGE